MGYSETRAQPTRAKHSYYQRSETGTENDSHLKGRISVHDENVMPMTRFIQKQAWRSPWQSPRSRLRARNIGFLLPRLFSKVRKFDQSGTVGKSYYSDL